MVAAKDDARKHGVVTDGRSPDVNRVAAQRGCCESLQLPSTLTVRYLRDSTFWPFQSRAACVIVSETGGTAIPDLRNRLQCEDGQDVAEYSIMLAVVLVIILGVVRVMGANASTVFSQVASTIQ